jgi:hypothetical protein
MRTRTGWRAWHWWAAVLLVTACGSRVPVAKPPTTPAVTATTTGVTTATTVPSVTSVAPTATTATTTAATPSTTAAFDEAAARAQIIANWEKFFTPGTPVDERVALLQNGAALRAAIDQSATNPLQQQASAKVTQVTFTSPTEATVTYDVYLNGAVALPNSQGMAVLEGGTWKVAQQSFCSLISLGVSGPIPGCS